MEMVSKPLDQLCDYACSVNNGGGAGLFLPPQLEQGSAMDQESESGGPPAGRWSSHGLSASAAVVRTRRSICGNRYLFRCDLAGTRCSAYMSHTATLHFTITTLRIEGKPHSDLTCLASSNPPVSLLSSHLSNS